MRATRYLAKLYDLPPERGKITALDSYASNVFVGTDAGLVLHFCVEGLPEYTRSATVETAPHDDAADEESIFTSLLSRVVVSDQRHAVTQLQHSRTQALLFVLCGGKLTVWNVPSTASAGHATGANDCMTFACEVATGIGAFFVAPRDGSTTAGRHAPRSPPATSMATRTPVKTHHHSSCTSSFSNAGSGSSGAATSGWTSTGLSGDGSRAQLICAAQRDGKSLLVLELDSVTSRAALHARGGVGDEDLAALAPRAVRLQELLLPEPALAVVITGPDTVCVGLREEYSLLSLSTGASRSILRLNGSAQRPLLAVGSNGDVYMRNRLSVFTTSAAAFGASNNAVDGSWTGSPNSSTRTPVSSPFAAGSSTGARLGAPQRVLGRTLHASGEPQLMVSRFPFLLFFCADHCDVFTAYDEEPVEQLPLPGCLYGSQLARGDAVFVASRESIWMVRLHPLRHQLADLVSSLRVDEAFQLLDAQRTRTGQSFREVTLELHVMAGFTDLHHCRIERAVMHFKHGIDARELTSLLPECVPPPPSSYSTALRTLLSCDHSAALRGCPTLHCRTSSLRSSASSGPAAAETSGTLRSAEDRTDAVVGLVEPLESEGYWEGWSGPCPYNVYTRPDELRRAWLETFGSFPMVTGPAPRTSGPASSRGSTGGVASTGGVDDTAPLLLRQVPDLGPVSSAFFVEHCWASLKTAVWETFADSLLTEVQMSRTHTSAVAVESRRAARGGEAADREGEEEEEEQESDTTSSTVAASGTSLPFSAPADAIRNRCRRAMTFALLVLALEARQYRKVYALVVAADLLVPDCFDLLLAVRAYRPLAVLLFRRGRVAAAQRLLQQRVALHAFLGPARRRVQAGLALRLLPGSMRDVVREVLEADGRGCEAGPDHVLAYTVQQCACPEENCEDNDGTRSANESDGSTWGTPCAAFHCYGPLRLRFPAPTQVAGARPLPDARAEAPGDLAEIFFLCDTLDHAALLNLLREQPAVARCRDSDGATALHHTLARLALLETGEPQPQSVKRSATTEPSDAAASDRSPLSKCTAWSVGSSVESQAALLQLVLGAVALLVSYGCPLSALTRDGWTCLDVAAGVCDGALLDIVVACVLSVTKVNAAASTAADGSTGPA